MPLSPKAATVGKSAQFTKMSSPRPTVTGFDQPTSSNRANWTSVSEAVGTIQEINKDWPTTAKYGSCAIPDVGGSSTVRESNTGCSAKASPEKQSDNASAPGPFLSKRPSRPAKGLLGTRPFGVEMDLGTNYYPFIEVFHVFICQPGATVRDSGANCMGLVRPMDT